MADGSMTDELRVPTAERQAETVEALQYRVQRLEDAVAAMQDTRLMEDRVAERVGMRLSRPPTPLPARETVLETGRRLLPLTIDAIRSTTTSSAPPPDDPPAEPAATTRTWLPLEAYQEALAMIRMYLDPHYRMSWAARLIPLVLLFLIVTSYVWLPGAALLPGLVSTFYVKAVDLVLAFMMFKYLHREARRFLRFEAEHYRPPY